MIKKILVVLVVMVMSIFAQIGSIKIAESENIQQRYDSTKNFLGEDAELYKGAILYLTGKAKQLRKYGYHNFKTKPTTNSLENVYKCCAQESKYNSNYESIFGTNFKVLNVEKVKNSVLYDYILTLKNLKDSSIAYFEYGSRYKHSFPFIDMRYFNKIKNNNLGKQYIVKENSFNIGKDIKDVNGVKIDSVWNYNWKCIDVLIEEEHFILSLLLQNEYNAKIVFDVENINDEKFMINTENAQKYKENYGEFWNKILRNIVSIGMNREMVKISWGEPEDINKTIHDGFITEQWVYGSRNYVYFNNGIVTAIQ